MKIASSLGEALHDIVKDDLEYQSALKTLEGYLLHFDAAILMENNVNAQRQRDSCLAALESILDRRQEQAQLLHRNLKKLKELGDGQG